MELSIQRISSWILAVSIAVNLLAMRRIPGTLSRKKATFFIHIAILLKPGKEIAHSLRGHLACI